MCIVFILQVPSSVVLCLFIVLRCKEGEVAIVCIHCTNGLGKMVILLNAYTFSLLFPGFSSELPSAVGPDFQILIILELLLITR